MNKSICEETVKFWIPLTLSLGTHLFEIDLCEIGQNLHRLTIVFSSVSVSLSFAKMLFLYNTGKEVDFCTPPRWFQGEQKFTEIHSSFRHYRNLHNNVCTTTLTHFVTLASSSTPWKQKILISDVLGGKEKDHSHDMG